MVLMERERNPFDDQRLGQRTLIVALEDNIATLSLPAQTDRQTHTHTHHLLSCLLAIHESLRDDPGGEDLVALAELLEEDSIGKPESADPDPLQDTVASQLL